MIVTKELTYLEHEGGTKFYEVAVFASQTTRRYVVVRRWGKIGSRHGGGETKIETFGSSAEAVSASRKVLNQKAGREYLAATFAHGFRSGKDDLEYDMLGEGFRRHYSDRSTGQAIMNNLGIGSTAAERLEVIAEDLFRTEKERKAAAAVAVVKPEPKRSNDWASW